MQPISMSLLARAVIITIALAYQSCEEAGYRKPANSQIQEIKTEWPSAPDIEDAYIDSQGDSLFVRACGEGRPLLVIHGGPGLDHSYFLPHLFSLARDFRVIFYDQRASGRSSIRVDSTTVSLQGFLTDIEKIREHYKFDQWHILGHSWGGLLALQYGLAFPEMIGKMILVNPMPGSSELQREVQAIQKSKETAEDSLAKSKIVQSEAFKNGDITSYEKLFRILFAAEFYNRDYTDSLQISFQSTFLEGNGKLRHLAKDISEYDIHMDLKELPVPVLLLYGEYDPLAQNAAETYIQYLPQAELHILPHAGHFPFVEQKVAFFETIKRFMDEPVNL